MCPPRFALWVTQRSKYFFMKAGFSNTVDAGHFCRTTLVCAAHGGRTAPSCKDFIRPRSIEGAMMLNICPGKYEIGSVLDVFVSEDQALMRIEIEVLSPLHGTAWTGASRAVTQRARQSSDFAPEPEAKDCVFPNAGAAVARAQPQGFESIGRPISFHCQTAPPPLPDRLHPGRARSRQAVHLATDCFRVNQRTTQTIRSHWKSQSATDDGM